MYFEIDRKSALERYVPYLLIVVFTPLIVGDYLMNLYLITGDIVYYIVLNAIVGVNFVLLVVLIIIMYMTYEQIEKNPAVSWLHNMGALEYNTLNETRIVFIDDIVFIEMRKARKGTKVIIHTDFRTTRFYFTKEGYTYWKDFLDNYIIHLDIPVEYNGRSIA